MENKLNVNRLAQVLSEILSEKYDMKITVSFHPKNTEQDTATDGDPAAET